jgi:hypothetical protein
VNGPQGFRGVRGKSAVLELHHEKADAAPTEATAKPNNGGGNVGARLD